MTHIPDLYEHDAFKKACDTLAYQMVMDAIDTLWEDLATELTYALGIDEVQDEVPIDLYFQDIRKGVSDRISAIYDNMLPPSD